MPSGDEKKKSDKSRKRREEIIVYIYQMKLPPTIREIKDNTNMASTSVVHFYLARLEKMGFIEREPKVSRGISLTRKGIGLAMLALDIKQEVCRHCGSVIQPPKYARENDRSGVKVITELVPT